MKELTLHEMENVSGAGVLDIPCAMTLFVLDSGLDLVKAGLNAGVSLTFSALEGKLDLITNLFNGSPSSILSIISNNFNSAAFSLSGVYQDLKSDIATNWGEYIYKLLN